MLKKLELIHCSIAKTEELLDFKTTSLKLDPFPGYSDTQWGIKAHARPWIIKNGQFQKNQKIIEIGGAYSTLPKYLAQNYNLDAWVGDDFGNNKEDIWKRWGEPSDLPKKNFPVKYIFQKMGKFSSKFKNSYFDRIFSVSTLEHIPYSNRLNVIKDMNRCLNPNGIQLHTIDISTNLKTVLIESFLEKLPLNHIYYKLQSEIKLWINLFEKSGIKINTKIPTSFELLNHTILVESPDVFFKYYHPINSPKKYDPAASLLIIIKSSETKVHG